MTTLPPYVNDLLNQPAALREALQHYPADTVEACRTRLAHDDFNRIVLTGMGSSFNSAYPAWLRLTELPLPVVHANTAEILHYARSVIDSRTLLWMNSQSGRSAEIVRLLQVIDAAPVASRPACILSMTNDLNSPLGNSADTAIAIHAGTEATVSSKTYVNMLALMMLAAEQLIGGDWQAMRQEMLSAADGMAGYLAGWQQRVDELDNLLGEIDQVFILGRGASLGAVWNGSLIIKEASKYAIEGMNAADFRHGPLELAAPSLTVFVLEGAPATAALNRDLAREVVALGGKALWVARQPDSDLPTLCLPAVANQVRPLVEILPIQMLTLALARRRGMEPGKFRHIGKITAQE